MLCGAGDETTGLYTNTLNAAKGANVGVLKLSRGWAGATMAMVPRCLPTPMSCAISTTMQSPANRQMVAVVTPHRHLPLRMMK
jgi:hypothetical protein